MSQNGIITSVASGGKALATDPQGALVVEGGGNSSALNVVSSTVVKATPGRVRRLSVITAVTSGGSIAIADAAVVSGTTSASYVYGPLAPAGGTVVPLDWPMKNGITVIVVSGGVCALAYD